MGCSAVAEVRGAPTRPSFQSDQVGVGWRGLKETWAVRERKIQALSVPKACWCFKV